MDDNGLFLATMIQGSARALAAGAVLRQLGGPPGAEVESFGEWTQEAETRLHYLAAALAAGRPALFLDHVDWLRLAYASRELPPAMLERHLASLREELLEKLPGPVSRPAGEVLEQAVALAGRATEPMEIAFTGPLADRAKEYVTHVLEGRRDEALKVVEDAVDGGADVWHVYSHVVGAAQGAIGRMWQMGELHVAEEHLASRIAEHVLDRLAARLPAPQPNGRRVLVSTVQGETHDIGARVVSDRLRSVGWNAMFLGASTPAEDLASAVRDFRADLLALSMNLGLHVITLSETIARVRELLGDEAVPVLVGGRPFAIVDDLWRVVGADACATSSHDAVAAAERAVLSTSRDG